MSPLFSYRIRKASSHQPMIVSIRDFVPEDKPMVDQVVRDAWIELAPTMPGWHDLVARLGALTGNAALSEVLVAELDGEIVGAAGYVGPNQPKPDFFAPEWPIVRAMSVCQKHGAMALARLYWTNVSTAQSAIARR